MADVCIVVICGLPASGKSFLSQQLLNISENDDKKLPYGFLVVEFDELLPAEIEKLLIEGEDGESKDAEGSSLWKKYRQSIHSCVDLLISKLSKSYDKSIQPNPDTTCGTGELWGRLVQRNSLEGILGGDDKRRMCVVIDDNMYYRSMRYSYFQLARKYNIGYGQIYLKTDVETAVIRNKQRHFSGVGEKTIPRMAERFEIPDCEKYTWETNTLILKDFQDVNDLCLQNICHVIDNALMNPVESLVEEDVEAANQSRDICSASFLHQSDQILRKLISIEMGRAKGAGITKPELKTLAANLQDVRKDISHQLKEGEITVPQDILSLSTDASKDDSSDLFLFLRECFDRRKKVNLEV